MDHPWTPTFASLTGSFFLAINPGADICPYYDRVILIYVRGHTQIWHNAGGTSYNEKNQGDVQT